MVKPFFFHKFYSRNSLAEEKVYLLAKFSILVCFFEDILLEISYMYTTEATHNHLKLLYMCMYV